MDIITIKPKNEILRKYIKSFYILNQNVRQQSKFIIFPSLFPHLSVSKNTNTTIVGSTVTTKKSENTLVECFLALNNSKPIYYTYLDEIFEISISFNPLGINCFLPENLQFYTQKKYYNFDIYEDAQDSFTKILATTDKNEAIETLEQYLLTKYKPFKHTFLENIIADLFDTQGNMSIEEITEKYQMSRQTLNTYFQRYICRSAIESKKIVRFRSASEHFFQKSLTELTYDTHYFDQSHLIKDFKALTGFTPKQFFSRLQISEGTHLIWA